TRSKRDWSSDVCSSDLVATIFHLYDRAWGVASIRELVTIAIAVTVTIILAMIVQKIALGNVPARTMVITWMLHIIMIGGSRFIRSEERRVGKEYNYGWG